MTVSGLSILIINQHSHNYGDDAAGTALVYRLLSDKNVTKIDIIYNSCDVAIPVVNPRLRHDLDISLRKVGVYEILKFFFLNSFSGYKTNSKILKKWLKIIDEADYIFVAPCGANIGIYKDWLFLFRVFMVIKRNKIPIFHYNTIGKSGNLVFDYFARKVLKCSKIYVRENKSHNYIKSLGMEAKYGPDTAFMLPRCKIEVRPKIIGFVPSEFDYWHPSFKKNNIDNYVQEILCKEIAGVCNNGSYKLELLPHLNTEREKKYYHLIKNKLIVHGLNPESILIRNDINNFMDYDLAIASCQFIIGMRYHTIVLAVKNYRPFISICYENKMIELCNYTNMNEYKVELASKSKGEVLRKFNYLLDNYEIVQINLCKFINSEFVLKLKEPTEFIDY